VRRDDLAAHEKIMAAMPPERVRTVAAKPPPRTSDAHRGKRPHHRRPKSPMVVDGKRYASFNDARVALAIGSGTLYRYIDSGRARYVK
jgi:hypothetical protein